MYLDSFDPVAWSKDRNDMEGKERKETNLVLLIGCSVPQVWRSLDQLGIQSEPAGIRAYCFNTPIGGT